MKASVLRVTGSVASLASCLVLFGGVASAQSISDTGHGSTNVIKTENSCTSTVKNVTKIFVKNDNQQNAQSGDVNVKDNDDVSNVSSGNASNTSSATFDFSVDNSGAGGCNTVSQAPTGGQGGETPTPVTPATPATTNTTTTVAAVGGMGGEVAAASTTPQVSVVPTGGVGAGTGGQTYLEGLVAVTLASGALGAVRLYKPLKTLSGRYS